MAQTMESEESRRVLIHMAHVWFRLAEQHEVADAKQE